MATMDLSERREMKDYRPTFAHLTFTTTREAAREADALTLAAIDKVAYLLEAEADENLAYDHFHPEIAAPLQQALYFLQLVKEGGT